MPIEGEGIHLRDGLRIIGKHRRVVVLFFVSTFTLVMLGTFSVTPQYRATTQVIIEKANPDVLTSAYRRDPYDPEFYETQIQLIQSHAVARRVVRTLSLEETYDTYLGSYNRSFLLQPLLKWAKKGAARAWGLLLPGDSQKKQNKLQRSKIDKLAAEIRSGIEVEAVMNSRIIAVSFLSPNPEFSALAANAVAKAYLEETLDMKAEATRRSLAWMTKKAEEERLKLQESEKRIQDFMRANNLVTLENKVALLPQQLSEVGSELIRAQAKREEVAALYKKVSSLGRNLQAAETIPAIASDPALRTLRSQSLEAEQNVMVLSGKYGKKHPSMLKAVADLEVLKEKKAQEIKRIIASIRNEYELVRSAENSLRSQQQRNKTEAQRVNENFIQYQALNRELETNRQLYDALQVKIKEQSIAEDNQPIVNFWIVEEARTPTSPAEPRKVVNALLGLVVGLFGGVGLAFFIEYLDNTIKDPEAAETALGIPVLGTVALRTEEGPIWEAVQKEPRSAFTESYKALRTALLLSSVGGAPKRVLLTSSISEEGKTTTAVNLSLVLAQSDNRVLLIDADMRKPRLHKIFNLANKSGLSTYLAGRSPGEEIFARGPLPNLYVITAGPIPPNPSELLSSARMKALMDSLGNQFDIIVCDSPPLLSVSDARLLCRIVDGTILVTKGAQTTFDLVRRALKMLQGSNAHVLGLVINALDLKKHDYYYHDYYSAYQEGEKKAVANERLERMVGGK